MVVEELTPPQTPQRQQQPQRQPPCLSCALPPQQVASLRSYLAHLLDVNRSMNLTAIRDPDEAWARHVEDSLALLPAIEARAGPEALARGLSLVDVGTGAGLPGMVLAVARPRWRVTLLDSLRKRCGFLEDAAARLGAPTRRAGARARTRDAATA